MRGGRGRRCLMSPLRRHKLEHPITPTRLISPPVTSRHISNKYIEQRHFSLIVCDFSRSEIDGRIESADWQAAPSLIQQFHSVILGLFHYLPWSMTETHFGPECSEKTCDMQLRRSGRWWHEAEKKKLLSAFCWAAWIIKSPQRKKSFGFNMRPCILPQIAVPVIQGDTNLPLSTLHHVSDQGSKWKT